MAFGDIILPPHLAPWQHAGVQWLLQEADVSPEQSLLGGGVPLACTASPLVRGQKTQSCVPTKLRENATGRETACTPPPEKRGAKGTGQHRRSTTPAAALSAMLQDGSAFAQSAPTSGMEPRSARENAIQDTTRGITHAVSPHGSQAGQNIIPPEYWPPLWQQRLSATQPAPVLWTYWELGEDFYGTPDPARRRLLQRLLKDMGHPAGTHSFWPCALPPRQGETGLEANAGVFWSGVQALKARVLAVLGAQALTAMGLSPMAPLRYGRHQGCQIIALREVSDLLTHEQHYAPMLHFLRTNLATFAVR